MPGYIVTASPNAVGTIMDKANTILVYSDYKSPYAFPAKDLIYELENKLDVDIEWLPYTLDIPSYLGSARTKAPVKFPHARDGSNGLALELCSNVADRAHQRVEGSSGVSENVASGGAMLR